MWQDTGGSVGAAAGTTCRSVGTVRATGDAGIFADRQTVDGRNLQETADECIADIAPGNVSGGRESVRGFPHGAPSLSLFVSRSARGALQLESGSAARRGRVPMTSFADARRLAMRLGAETGTPWSVSAGELVALAVLDDFHRTFFMRYLRVKDPHLVRRAVEHLVRSIGGESVVAEVARFADAFGLGPASEADDGSVPRTTVDEDVVIEMLLYWLQSRNRAARGVTSVLSRGFDPTPSLTRLFGELERFLTECEGLEEEKLAAELLAPMDAHPDSLALQLAFVRRRWGALLGGEGDRLQQALDLIAEEGAPRWGPPGPPGSGPPVAAPMLPEDLGKHYSDDRDWMAELVLAAKNTLVWLEQMSRAYGREISRLDQIPDAELALLAGRGFSGLWLIGLWERSPASAEIKRRRGNPEAASSAYSLRGYRIAHELGGEEALADLRRRAASHGLRLAADMVPNHMGIDSDWVLEHPKRFVQVATPPYPAYSFNGPDLSPRSDVGIYLEDHYYDGTDAAVVFRRLDRSSGEETFIYHGNDGTSMPWNDTAQLDYLDPVAREAVLATILDVARRFSVIRFDAAMTLTRRHYQRLWHPQPGDAGAIPSRSEHGLSRDSFNERMPREFWREVVDRVAQEAPDTLLLAEAFWLMEGYFVRTLGLHRVYNSAFMHMMRDRETGKLRRMLEETLAFDPEILRRYVNFMSNPDEEPAAEQFGHGDRYFGACAVLATLPGLPMFAHGQWDGLGEKYGMEYRRAYRDESPNRGLIDRHDREIAPLLRDRHRFAGVDHFWVFGFRRAAGTVEDNVLAYSNGPPENPVLVMFNNSENSMSGWIHESVPVRRGGEDAHPETRTVAEVLGISEAAVPVVRFRDAIAGASYLAVGAQVREQGLLIELKPFQAVALAEFRPIDDPTGAWTRFAARLHGRGTDDLDRALLSARGEPLRQRLAALADELMRAAAQVAGEDSGPAGAAEMQIEPLVAAVAESVSQLLSGPPLSLSTVDELPLAGIASGLTRLVSPPAETLPGEAKTALADLRRALADQSELRWAMILEAAVEVARAAVAEGLPRDSFEDVVLEAAPLSEAVRADLKSLITLVVDEEWHSPRLPPGAGELAEMTAGWGWREAGRRLLGAHEAEGVEWIVREKLETLLRARLAFAIAAGSPAGAAMEDAAMAVVGWTTAMKRLSSSAKTANYRFRDWV